jgi:hypothetical protein
MRRFADECVSLVVCLVAIYLSWLVISRFYIGQIPEALVVFVGLAIAILVRSRMRPK